MTVDRYPFPVPEWTRVQWVSEEAQALWQPRLAAIAAAWSAAEFASVGRFRDATLVNLDPAQLPEVGRRSAERGLVVLPLAQQATGGSYQAGSTGPPQPGQPFVYRAAVVTRAAALPWIEAWEAGDDEAMGRMLGYPECCRAFFQQVWVEEGWIDTTWPMSRNSVIDPDDRRSWDFLEHPMPSEDNILLRWLGVRWVPHLPCSFSCQPTVELGTRFRGLVPETEASWMDALLSAPLQWSALHGVALIETPILTISAKTDATRQRLTVRRRGLESTPPLEAAATGTRFPYAAFTPRGDGYASFTPESRTYALLPSRRSESRSTPSTSPPDPSIGPPRDRPQGTAKLKVFPAESSRGEGPTPDSYLWTDNGFSSLEAMEAAHAVVIETARAGLNGSTRYASVLDLGCGNGRLVSQIPAAIRRGVEVEPTRAARAVDGVSITVGPITSAIPEADLVLLMPGRGIDGDLPDLDGCRLLLYAYDDWLTRYGDLPSLVAAAGLDPRRLTHLTHDPAAQAAAALYNETAPAVATEE